MITTNPFPPPTRTTFDISIQSLAVIIDAFSEGVLHLETNTLPSADPRLLELTMDIANRSHPL